MLSSNSSIFWSVLEISSTEWGEWRLFVESVSVHDLEFDDQVLLYEDCLLTTDVLNDRFIIKQETNQRQLVFGQFIGPMQSPYIDVVYSTSPGIDVWGLPR